MPAAAGAAEPVAESIGLGQLIKGATRRVGLQPCPSCERRAQRLDQWVSFRSVGRRGSGRSVVVLVVVGACTVGGSVAGGWLGRRAGSAVGTRLREKMRPRVARPERLDSLPGYAEQGGEVLGSLVGGIVAGLAALSLTDRFLALAAPLKGYCDDPINLQKCNERGWQCCQSLNKVCGGCCGKGETCCLYGQGGCSCVDLATDNSACGDCNVRCGPYQRTCCNSRCVDLESDNDNCGRCGSGCRHLVEYCSGGKCVPSRFWKPCGDHACRMDDFCWFGICVPTFLPPGGPLWRILVS